MEGAVAEGGRRNGTQETGELTQVQKAELLGQAALERKAEDLIALDVRQVTSFADTILLATGRSDRQVRAIADAVEAAARKAGMGVLGVEGYEDGRWVLIDLADAVVHVFQPDVRAHYDLERLWSDAPVLELGLDAGAAESATR
jgi:ribosome-associated protein